MIFRELCRRRLEPLKPDAVVVTCGADALKGDPLSSMEVSNEALGAVTLAATSLADHAVVLGGGGYNPWTTVRMWAGLWARLSGQPVPARLPAPAREILSRLSCDLVDDEDCDPAWLDSISDPANAGPIRPRIHELIEAAMPRATQPRAQTGTSNRRLRGNASGDVELQLLADLLARVIHPGEFHLTGAWHLHEEGEVGVGRMPE